MAKARSTTKPCPAMIACDGSNILLDRDMCGRCRDAQEKRARAKPLRGDNCKAKGTSLSARDLAALDR